MPRVPIRPVCLLIACLCWSVAPPSLASQGGMYAANEVSQASYYDFMDNWLFTHVGDNRGPQGPELVPCRENIKAFLESYGLSVTLEPFNWSGGTYHNVVATKLGTLYPDQEYIIGAHYDSVSNPGADDNASGVALVLEAARIISQYDSDYTIRFVAFSMEEVGLIGSEEYVYAHWADDILGMISADMVAHNTTGYACNIYGRSASDPIKNSLADAVVEYSNGLSVNVRGDLPASDHAPFEQAGIQACLLIEAANNPYYHTQNDSFEQPGNLHFPFAERMTRSVVGWLVDAAGVQVDHLAFVFPNDFPEYCAPNGGTTIRFETLAVGAAVPQPGTVTFHYDVGSGWESVAPTEVSAGVYDAVIPASTCGGIVEYYFTMDDTLGETYASPIDAPGTTYSATSADGQLVMLSDDFESDQGWTVQNQSVQAGAWERGIPAGGGTRGDPVEDFDGSGACFLTGNAAGDADLDGGPTRLISPAYDLSGGAGHFFRYACWFYNNNGDEDALSVHVSDDDGASWVFVEKFQDGAGGWLDRGFAVADYVTPTNQVRIRFSAVDNPNNSITEAAIDALRITMADCGVVLGDMDCDGQFDYGDINPFVLALVDPDQYEVEYPDCDRLRGDFDDNGQCGFEDINPFVAGLTSP